MKTKYTDIGINLINKQFRNDIDSTINRAMDNDVRTMIMTGTSLKNSEESLKIAKKHKGTIYSTAGIHPHNAKEYTETVIQRLSRLLEHSEVVAVGECGLDFDRDFSPRMKQETCFRAHLELAVNKGKPLFLHERAAFVRFNQIIDDYVDKISNSIVHCFTGNIEQAKVYLDKGFYIGFTGAITDTRRFDHLKKVIRYIPSDRYMIETDAPFMLPKNIPYEMGPKGNHKRRNEPQFLPYVAKYLAECRNESLEEVAIKSTQNAEQFFGF